MELEQQTGPRIVVQRCHHATRSDPEPARLPVGCGIGVLGETVGDVVDDVADAAVEVGDTEQPIGARAGGLLGVEHEPDELVEVHVARVIELGAVIAAVQEVRASGPGVS